MLNELSERFSEAHETVSRGFSIIPNIMRHQCSKSGKKRQHNSDTKAFSEQSCTSELTIPNIRIQRINKPWKQELLNFVSGMEKICQSPHVYLIRLIIGNPLGITVPMKICRRPMSKR